MTRLPAVNVLKKARWIGVWLVVVLVQHVAVYGADEGRVSPGQLVYERSCATCHGVLGEGDGPAAFYNSAYLGSRPRDFTVGNYKYRSTASGEFPTDEDLLRVITDGISGMMPGFRGLSELERRQVLAYLKTLTPGMEQTTSEPIVLPGSPITSSNASIARGREVYVALDCHTCHGEEGDGQGDVRKDLVDEQGLPARATDFRYREEYRNGATPNDIIRSLWTGLDGTAMPSYAAQFQGQEDDVWHLVNYLLSLMDRS